MQGTIRGVATSFVGVMLCLAGNSALADEPLKLPGTTLEPVTWSALADWTSDDHLAAFAAFQRSCQVFRKRQLTNDHGPIYGALWHVCQRVAWLQPSDSA